MKDEKAIPEGYMTVGEIAKKMGITVRTLQYYDKEGLLCPSAESPGGRRLYTDKDLIKLHEFLSLKNLGFSLKEIKNHLSSLDTPEEVAAVLTKQEKEIQVKIETLTKTLNDIKLLKSEVLQMKTVDFKKYSDILVNLDMNNEYYWLIKHFDEPTLDYLRKRFDKESAFSFMETFQHLSEEILILQQAQITPDSAEAQVIAESFWNTIIEFTNGDFSMLPMLMKMSEQGGADNKWTQMQTITTPYIEKALEYYFDQQGINPFIEKGTE